MEHIIIKSYERLIGDCQENIKKGINVEENKLLENEYKKVLKEFKSRLTI